MKVKVNVPQNNYLVHIGENNFSQLKVFLTKEKVSGSLLLVIDSIVSKLYANLIDDALINYSGRINKVIIKSTEKDKSFDSIQKIHKALIKNNFGRDSVVIAIGGGIVGDIAGFAASTYMRGIKYVQVPTTLLAAVDSSVGGKTGINFSNTKNIVGTFYQPEFVLIDTNFFDSLKFDERLCGLGEIVKYAFLTNTRFFNSIDANYEKILNVENGIIKKVIKESVSFKSGVVEADEKEAGIRKVLNLGHTFAHAFEVEQNHQLKHGQAVIVGIMCALHLSFSLDLISDSEFKKYMTFLFQFSSMIKLRNPDVQLIYKYMLKDKKNRNDQIKFVLVKKIGEIVTDVPAEKKLVIDSIKKTISDFN